MSARKYTREHEWIEPAGQTDVWRVGISDFAQDQLGDVVTVELPEVGAELDAQAACAVVESVKSASDIYAPMAGRITAVNDKLLDEPELVNSAAEGDGWLFEIQASGPVDESALLDEAAYKEYTAEA